MRTGAKSVMRSGIVAALAYAGWRAWRKRVPESTHDISWDSAPFPFPPVPRPARAEKP